MAAIWARLTFCFMTLPPFLAPPRAGLFVCASAEHFQQHTEFLRYPKGPGGTTPVRADWNSDAVLQSVENRANPQTDAATRLIV